MGNYDGCDCGLHLESHWWHYVFYHRRNVSICGLQMALKDLGRRLLPKQDSLALRMTVK